MKIKPIAFDSLGVRSMCTYINTDSIRILIDPGVSLGRRYGKIPHPREYRQLKKKRKEIYEMADKTDLIIITHYHFDHYTPLGITDYLWTWTNPEEASQIYQDKIVLIKDFKEKINMSQRRRGWIFTKLLEKINCKVKIADSKKLMYGDTTIKISDPVPHGEKGTPLGYVLMVEIESGDERFLYSSDVQGPICIKTRKIIEKEKPEMLIIGDPPTYLPQIKRENIESAIKNMIKLSEKIPNIIVDHHLLRDVEWEKYINMIKENCEHCKIQTAAENIGETNMPLESLRNILYEKDPPSNAFLKWSKLPYNKIKNTMPPI